jgi:hypothetical protein
MKEDGVKEPWYFFPLIHFTTVISYVLITWFMALVNIRRAFLFNTEFEDHAEHVYAQFIAENPQWEDQPVHNELVKQYGDLNRSSTSKSCIFNDCNLL